MDAKRGEAAAAAAKAERQRRADGGGSLTVHESGRGSGSVRAPIVRFMRDPCTSDQPGCINARAKIRHIRTNEPRN